MMRKLSQTLFYQAKRAQSYRFSKLSEQKESQSKKEQIAQILEQSQNNEEDYQYKQQDRSTTGWMIYRFFFWGSMGVLGHQMYKVATHQKNTPVEDQPGTIPGFITAAKFLYNKYSNVAEFMTKPPAQKLLPDVIHPLLHPKTLVLNVTGTLIQTDYVFGKGLIIKKRPGLQLLLNKLKNNYEIILFSDDDSMMLQSLIPTIDPRQQFIRMYFGQECMVFSGRKYIKDLKYLNRDLRNVVVIDVSKDKVPRQRDNVIPLSIYKGDQQDKELLQLLPLLENLSKPQVKDVRKHIADLGENPLQKYTEILKQKQEKIKQNKSSKIFGAFSKK